MKYQIADQVNGPFGDIFDNLADAEKALQEAIEEGQAINDAHAAECEEAGVEIAQAADFFEIVELENDPVQIIFVGDDYEIANEQNSEIPDWPVCDSSGRWFSQGFEGQRVAYPAGKLERGFYAVECDEEDGQFFIDGKHMKEI